MSGVEAMEEILRHGWVMPVVTIQDPELGPDLARALVKGGLRIVEVTLRTPGALAAIRAIRSEVPECLVGAGTVLNEDDLGACIDAGAAFAISPGATDTLLATARHAAIPYLPAVATASEVMRGLDWGYRHFKFFPAESAGGVAALKALHGPFPTVRFCPTGGIDEAKVPSYLALPNVSCVGGSWIVPQADLDARNFDAITAHAARASAF